MQIYQFYFLDRNDVVVTVRAFSAMDDDTAVREGRRLQRAHTIEICSGDRRVDRLEMRWRGRLSAPPLPEGPDTAAKPRPADSQTPEVGRGL
jgi:hypothetical protein